MKAGTHRSMNTLEENIIRLLNAGFKLELESDGNTFTARVVDEPQMEKSAIKLENCITGLRNFASLEAQAAIVNAEHKLKYLDPENVLRWKKYE